MNIKRAKRIEPAKTNHEIKLIKYFLYLVKIFEYFRIKGISY